MKVEITKCARKNYEIVVREHEQDWYEITVRNKSKNVPYPHDTLSPMDVFPFEEMNVWIEEFWENEQKGKSTTYGDRH